MKFEQTHITCYGIAGIDTDIPRYIELHSGKKKIGKDTYHFQVRLLKSVEKALHAHWFERGIATGLLTGLFGKSPNEYLSSLDDYAKNKTKEALVKNKVQKIYLVVKIWRLVDLDLTNNKFVAEKQGFYIGIEAFSGEKRQFSTDIEPLANYFVCKAFSSLTVQYEGIEFSKCFIRSYYRGLSGKHLFDYFPQFGGHVVVTKKESSSILRKLARSMRKAVIEYDPKGLHLYRKMIDEQDPLKKFLFGYFGLEIASNKAYKTRAKSYNIRPFIHDKRDIADIYAEMQDGYGQDTKNSRDKFILNSFFQWESITKNDFAKFKKSKDVRDRLSHGAVPEDRDIPIREINDVLAKVMQNELR